MHTNDVGTKLDTRRVAVVGTGHRAGVFMELLAMAHRDDVDIVGLCDTNPVRLDHYRRKLAGDWGYPNAVDVFTADGFDRMIEQIQPTDVLVCTPDHLHAEFVCRSLEAGCDVIVEKPVAVDAAGCNRIMETARTTGRTVRVAFNCRFLPAAVLVKQQLLAGSIGEVLSGSLDYMIGAGHGATYFARWHALKSQSGGLLVHKASHHFDLINWWLDAIPKTLFATGRRGFFGAENRAKHGIRNEATHYLDGDTGNDPFQEVFQTAEDYYSLYVRGAEHDGYRPDRNVWQRNDIDIEDAMAVTMQYSTGAVFSYTLNAFSPLAGFQAVFNGVKGRLEIRTEFDAHLSQPGGEEPETPFATRRKAVLRDRCVVYPLYGEAYELEIPTAEGSHSGSDPVMMMQLFSAFPDLGELDQHAGPEQGAASALTGIAANLSIEEGRSVALSETTPAFEGRVHLHELS